MNEKVRKTIGVTLVTALSFAVGSLIMRDNAVDETEPENLQLEIPKTVSHISPETEIIINDEFITTVAYWKDQGVNLEDTQLVVLKTDESMQCGNDERKGADTAAAFYCIPKNAVVLSELFIDKIIETEPEGDHRTGGFDVVIAHELAHVVQQQHMTTKSKFKDRENIVLEELQADCMAGMSMEDMGSARIEGAYIVYNSVVPLIDFSHGMGFQRSAAFTLGLDGGNCTISDIQSITS